MDGETGLGEVLELIARDRRAMLERIGAAVNVGNPEAVYRKIAAESGSATTRERLARAWAAAGEAHEQAVARAVDELLREKKVGSERVGGERAGEERAGAGRVRGGESGGGWSKSGGSRGGLRGYQMVQEAVAAQEKLDAEVRAVTGTAHCPSAHFWYALRTIFGEMDPPSFTLERCMAFVGKVARDEFGLELAGTGRGRVSFVEARALFRAVGEAIGRSRRERYRAAWFEMWAYHPEFAGDYGRVKLAERRQALLERVVAAMLESMLERTLERGGLGGVSSEGSVREQFALLDSRFGVGSWCTLGDVARHLLGGRVLEGLREEAWCAKRMPGGGTIFAFYEASGQLKQSLQS